jgi:hypothetical protein
MDSYWLVFLTNILRKEIIFICLGIWSLAEMSDLRSIEVSLQLCFIEQQNTRINATSLTLSELFTQLNSSQFDSLLYCDRDNRVHSQQWLVYSYLQRCEYKKSINTLSDLILSNRISPFDQYYLPYTYTARAYVISNIFFWAMYNTEKNQKIFDQTMDEILVQMDSNPIQILTDTNIDSTYFERYEAAARFGMFQTSIFYERFLFV